MSKWDIDKLICTGLIAALIIFVSGQIALIFFDKTPLPMELGTTIVAGFIGYMNRSPIEKNQEKPDETPKSTLVTIAASFLAC